MNLIAVMLRLDGELNVRGFWFGLIALAVIGLGLALGARAGVGALGFAGVLLLYPYAAVFAKRFRAKGGSAALALVPLLIGAIGWVTGVLVIASNAYFGLWDQFAVDNGHALAESRALLSEDRELVEAFQAYIQTQEGADALAAARDARGGDMILWGSAAFWALSLMVAVWPGTNLMSGPDVNTEAKAA